MKKRVFIPGSIPVPTATGDGIGHEIMPAIIEIHQAADSPIKFLTGYNIGQAALDAGEELIPQKIIDAFTEHKILFKGPLATPKGTGHKSINLTLRDMFDLYNNYRPVKSLPGITSRFKNVDLIVIRENTEDLYKNTEEYAEDGEEATITFKLSKQAARLIFEAAVQTAKAMGRERITFVHKSNIIKAYGRLYTEVMLKEIAPKYPELIFEEYVIDAYCEKVVMNPNRFDVVVGPNLFGDIISDLHLGLIGGIGYGAGANLGHEYAMFEAIHGSADGTDGIYGKNIANPSGMLLSSTLMLRHVGDNITADRIEGALFYVLGNNKDKCTPDCLGNVDDETRAAHPGNTTTMKNAIIAALQNEELEFNKVAATAYAQMEA